MYVMLALIFGSFLVGATGRLSHRAQGLVSLAAVVAATVIYYVSQRAM